MYVIKVRPLRDKLMNYIEIYNEVTLLSSTVLMIGFTDYTIYDFSDKKEEDNMRDTIGWIIIGIVSVYILINLFLVFKSIYDGLKISFGPCIKRF